MHLQHLTLTHFRNYQDLSLTFEPGLTTFVGPNAQGKTNVLEAVFFLNLMKSFRGTPAKELISWGLEYSRLTAELSSQQTTPSTLEVFLDARQGGLKKSVKLNGAKSTLTKYLGQLPCVTFLPEHLNIVSGAPSLRRQYLDLVLSQAHKPYLLSIAAFSKALRQRNQLLKSIREGTADQGELVFWDHSLITEGQKILDARDLFIDFANSHLTRLYHSIAREVLDTSSTERHTLSLNYRPSTTEPSLASAISANRQTDIAAGTTTAGPHRDDFELEWLGRPLHKFGSRGEQRSSILALKIVENLYLEETLKTRPLLLLDDVFSELDEGRRRALLAMIESHQTLLTTTDEAFVEHLGSRQVLRVDAGTISQV